MVATTAPAVVRARPPRASLRRLALGGAVAVAVVVAGLAIGGDFPTAFRVDVRSWADGFERWV